MKTMYGAGGSPVAHKGGKLNPTGYINREINKGKKVRLGSTRRSGLAKLALQRSAKRRLANQRIKPKKLGG